MKLWYMLTVVGKDRAGIVAGLPRAPLSARASLRRARRLLAFGESLHLRRPRQLFAALIAARSSGSTLKRSATMP